MAGKRKPPRRSGRGGGGNEAGKKIAGMLGDWVRLTFSDRQQPWGLPVQLKWVNLAVLVLIVAVGYFAGLSKWLVIVFFAWFLTTLGRSAMIMPKRRRQVQSLYENTCRTLGNQRGTATNPIDPASRVKVKRWIGERAEDVSFTVGECPAAASELTHPSANGQVIRNLGDPPEGKVWVAEWPKPLILRAHLEDADAPAALRQTYRDKTIQVVWTTMKIQTRDADKYGITFDGWQEKIDRAEKSHQIPTTIVITTGLFDTSNPANRDLFVRAFDRQIAGPGEWIYQWGTGEVEITLVPMDDPQALQKRAERKIGDDVQGALRSRAKDPAVTAVTRWIEDDEQTVDHPAEIEVDFGTRNMADRRVRADFENVLDTALSASYPESTWLYDWRPGSATMLSMTAVGVKSEDARRKRAETRLRNVVESKFGKSKNFVDCDVVRWFEDLSESGEALPAEALVNFGNYDVTKKDTRLEFEQHWDSQSTNNDWHYNWSPAEGEVSITAVPRLQDAVAFPNPGTPEFETIMRNARDGKFWIGPQKGGGDRYWNMNSIPHGLYGGATGSGKSVALNLIFFYAAWNPDMLEVIVIDPKMTDFTWTQEFPATIKFAATDTEIVEAVSYAKQQMDKRRSLLKKLGPRNIRGIRKLFRENPELEREYGPAPKRIILLFDELAEAMAKGSNQDMEELKQEAKNDLDSLGRLARAAEVNIVAALQKLDKDVVSRQLTTQLKFRCGVGRLDDAESKQILFDNHGTIYPDSGTPPGRAWTYDSAAGYRLVQVPFMPDEDEPCPWDDSIQLRGLRPMLREHMKELGYQQITVQNSDGGDESRWVTVDVEGDDNGPEEPIEGLPAATDADALPADDTGDASVIPLFGAGDDAEQAGEDDEDGHEGDEVDPAILAGEAGWRVHARLDPLPAGWP